MRVLVQGSSSLPRKGALAVLGFVGLCLASSLGYAKAPKGRYGIANGEVTDSKTGLIWRQTLNPAVVTYANALNACTALGGNWRTPNIKELFSLVDESTNVPSIDEDAFPGTPTTYMWSSTPLAGDATAAWAVNFGIGSVGHTQVSDLHQVRCVR